jgi:hypothetical protein
MGDADIDVQPYLLVRERHSLVCDRLFYADPRGLFSLAQYVHGHVLVVHGGWLAR